ncbi:hypothetical protein HDU76_004446 [Blyttiomyces sp. JEL0837]|nr:hypothetical protein HDU76_004446 [Blyttiomyces sp. JEL0837]
MAQLLAAGTMSLTAAAMGVFYFQPHSVIALLVKGFPRIIWCLSSVSPPLKATKSRSASETPSSSAAHGSDFDNSGLPTNTNTGGGAGADDNSSMAWKEMKGGFQRMVDGVKKQVPTKGSLTVSSVRITKRAKAAWSSVANAFGVRSSGSMEVVGQEVDHENDVEMDERNQSPTVATATSTSIRIQDDEFVDAEEGFAAVPTADRDMVDGMGGSDDSLHQERHGTNQRHDDEERLPGVSEKVVALTIDDSPSVYTSDVLDVLKENNASATFFIIGDYVEKLQNGETVLRRMVDEGHELGNHTWYDRPTIRLPSAVFEDELLRVDTIISRVTNNNLPTSPTSQQPLKWFRPGSGLFSQEMCDIAERYGYRTVLGCRFPLDTTSPDPRLNAWHVSKGIHPGAIIVLHDYRERIIETLRILLPDLNRQGYKVVNISELYQMASVGNVPTGIETLDPCFEDAREMEEVRDGPGKEMMMDYGDVDGVGVHAGGSFVYPPPPLPARKGGNFEEDEGLVEVTVVNVADSLTDLGGPVASDNPWEGQV